MTIDTTEFRAWRVEETDAGFVGRERTLRIADLPDGEVLVRVAHSSLNYKDALSASGNRGVTRQYPHTPGIDAAGEVVASSVDAVTVGRPEIVTG